MHYDDGTRRFNFLSGFLLGLMLGGGLVGVIRPAGARSLLPARKRSSRRKRHRDLPRLDAWARDFADRRGSRESTGGPIETGDS